MGKIYKGIGGYISRLTQIGGGGDPGIRSERRFNASLIRGDYGGG